MKEKVRFLGLDVHAETIAVAVAEPDGSIRSLWTIANRAESIRTLVKKLGSLVRVMAEDIVFIAARAVRAFQAADKKDCHADRYQDGDSVSDCRKPVG
jgi:hypothetical protein